MVGISVTLSGPTPETARMYAHDWTAPDLEGSVCLEDVLTPSELDELEGVLIKLAERLEQV